MTPPRAIEDMPAIGRKRRAEVASPLPATLTATAASTTAEESNRKVMTVQVEETKPFLLFPAATNAAGTTKYWLSQFRDVSRRCQRRQRMNSERSDQ